MFTMSLDRVASCTGGQLMGSDKPMIVAVSTDSRSVVNGELFVALRGDNFDGAEFTAAAAQRGAAAVMQERVTQVLPCVLVENSLVALGLLARENRRHFTGPVIGITGSSGKTSTKEMISSILAECGRVHATPRNLNNEIGVPQTLLGLSSEHEFAVVEMGAAKPGDINYLCEFVEPTISVLTNAQAAHIQGFGSVDAVAATKGEIFQCLSPSGIAVINADDVYCDEWLATAKQAQRCLFSLSRDDVDVYARDIDVSVPGATRFTLVTASGSADIQLPVPGRHMVANALAAAAASMAAGAEIQQVVSGLESMQLVAGRLSLATVAGVSLIDDSYNANPGSVGAAIEVLAAYRQRKILVLGQMAELGTDAEAIHQQLALAAKQAGVDTLFAVGDYAVQMAESFGENGHGFSSKERLLAALLPTVQRGDVILVKGSRSAGMEMVVQQLSNYLLREDD